MRYVPDLAELIAPAPDALRCPRCSSRDLRRWGQTRGRQRHRCSACGRTFNPHTLTAIAYTKRLDQWPVFLHHMERGATLRQSAVLCGVHLSTVFRWRHATLRAIRTRAAPPLDGEVELAVLRFPWNRKGRRDLEEPRKRGCDQLHVDHLYVPRCRVLAARARDGRVRTFQAGDFVDTRLLSLFLRAQVRQDTVLTSHPEPSVDFANAARQCGLAHSSVGYGHRPRPCDYIAIDAYGARLRLWLQRFRGVATRYLTNYLAWHRRGEGDTAAVSGAQSPWRFANARWEDVLVCNADPAGQPQSSIAELPCDALPPARDAGKGLLRGTARR